MTEISRLRSGFEDEKRQFSIAKIEAQESFQKFDECERDGQWKTAARRRQFKKVTGLLKKGKEAWERRQGGGGRRGEGQGAGGQSGGEHRRRGHRRGGEEPGSGRGHHRRGSREDSGRHHRR